MFSCLWQETQVGGDFCLRSRGGWSEAEKSVHPFPVLCGQIPSVRVRYFNTFEDLTLITTDFPIMVSDKISSSIDTSVSSWARLLIISHQLHLEMLIFLMKPLGPSGYPLNLQFTYPIISQHFGCKDAVDHCQKSANASAAFTSSSRTVVS